MKIAIGIPTYNRDDVLINTVMECLSQSRKADEIIIVDQTANHSEEVQEKLREWIDQGLIMYHFQSKPSLPMARNKLLQMCQSDVIIFIDDDVNLPSDFVEKHEANYKNDKSVVAVAGGIDQRLGWPKINRPQSWPRVLDYRYLKIGGKFRSENVANFTGANHSVLVKKAMELGGYDERLRGVALREESDFALRIYSAGGKIVFDPEARLLHLAIPTGGCRKKNPLDINAARSNLLFTFKHFNKLGFHSLKEFWLSVRLGVLNKTNLNNPFFLLVCFLKFSFYLIEIPYSLLFVKSNSQFYRG